MMETHHFYTIAIGISQQIFNQAIQPLVNNYTGQNGSLNYKVKLYIAVLCETVSVHIVQKSAPN